MASVQTQSMSQHSLPKQPRSTWPVWITFALFFVPVVIAWVLYFVVRPDMRSNYGDLIDPQLDIPSELSLKHLSGELFSFDSLKGKWILVQVAQSDCDQACQVNMFYQRQIRTSTGKEQTRIERVVLVTDNGPLETMLLRQFDGVHFVRADIGQLEKWLPVKELTGSKTALKDHVYIIDPLGHVMLRFPPNIDPTKMRKDISRLLWASKIG